MKFTVYPHKVSYYMTQEDDRVLEFIPIEDFTLIKLDKNTYALPFGAKDYQSILQTDSLKELFEKTITGIGVSKYEVHKDKVLSELRDLNLVGEDSILSALIAKELPDDLSTKDYLELITNIVEVGELKVNEAMIKKLSKLGKELKTDLTELVYPAFVELLKQLNDAGILDDIKDPALMMKRYQGDK